MRDIKFRAWDTIKRRMVNWDEFIANENIFKASFLNAKHSVGLLGMLKEFHYCPMQYTGVKDKNGVEIYEGDILGHPFSGMTVEYRGDQGSGLEMDCGYYLQKDDFESWIELKSRSNKNGDNYEVIGNIYENPDLLDESKKQL